MREPSIRRGSDRARSPKAQPRLIYIDTKQREADGGPRFRAGPFLQRVALLLKMYAAFVRDRGIYRKKSARLKP